MPFPFPVVPADFSSLDFFPVCFCLIFPFITSLVNAVYFKVTFIVCIYMWELCRERSGVIRDVYFI